MKVIIAVAIFGLISTVSAAEPKCPKDDGILLPNPDDCTTYFTCRGGFLIITSCPNGLHFDPKHLECDFPEDAGCEVAPTSTTPQPTTPKYPVNCPVQTNPNDNILLANPKDCSSFYHCSYGIPHLQYCPAGLHFDDKSKRCDWPYVAKCVASFLEKINRIFAEQD